MKSAIRGFDFEVEDWRTSAYFLFSLHAPYFLVEKRDLELVQIPTLHRFRPLWLRSSVVSVLLSVTAGTVVTCDVYCHPDFWN